MGTKYLFISALGGVCMDNEKLRTAGTHFLEFAFSFLTFAKCQYQSANHIKINSLPFFTLSILADQKDENYTMSDLADKLQITKQQLSKLINDLEDKALVERIHDTANRRRVYIRISPCGLEAMERLKETMLETTIAALHIYNEEELETLNSCLESLTPLMEKFHLKECGE